MGYQPGFQPKLFYHQINLEERVPQDHLLRKIQEKIDFDFIYVEVKDTYGDNGNVSIPPPVILKMSSIRKEGIYLIKKLFSSLAAKLKGSPK